MMVKGLSTSQRHVAGLSAVTLQAQKLKMKKSIAYILEFDGSLHPFVVHAGKRCWQELREVVALCQ